MSNLANFDYSTIPPALWWLLLAAAILLAGISALIVWLPASRQRTQARFELQRASDAMDSLSKQHAQLQNVHEAQREQLNQTAQTLSGAQSSLQETRQRAQQLEQTSAEQATALDAARQQLATLKTRAEETERATRLRVQELTESRESFRKDFEALANRIFDEKSQRFSSASKEQLGLLLNPLKEQLGDFKKQVSDAYGQESQQRAVLKTEIKQLAELNQRLTQEADTLAKALRGQSKTRGNWGEMILTQVLEASGLIHGDQFETQVSLKTADNSRALPDAIVRLPDERDIVIDAKVSLQAHLALTEADDEAARADALKRHVQSVRTHIKQLGNKAYHDAPGVRSLDFTVMFIPNEPAYIEALRAEPKLFADALDAGIGLASPTTLMAILRVVENLWRTDKQNKNAAAIAERAGTLYDKFVGFAEDLDKVEQQMERATRSLSDAKGKLATGPGNLARQAEMLKELGARTGKALPQSLAQD